jgi:hypothetical protein
MERSTITNLVDNLTCAMTYKTYDDLYYLYYDESIINVFYSSMNSVDKQRILQDIINDYSVDENLKTATFSILLLHNQ